MDIKELKEQIENKTLPNKAYIFKYTDNKFLCYQYVNAISTFRKEEKLYISSPHDIEKTDEDFFESVDSKNSNLYILDIDTLDMAIDFSNPAFKNLIVICKDIKITNLDFIEIPKLLNWQIDDYVKLMLPGLTQLETSWLCDVANHDIYRLQKEIDKLRLFNPKEQAIIFNNINDENGYLDLNSKTIFDFTNAFIKKDKATLANVLNNIDNIDIEPTGVITLLIKNFKNIIKVQLSTKTQTPDDLKLSDKQYYAIRKYSTNYYKNDDLINIYQALTEIDYKLKSGFLANEKIVDYIVCKILEY